MKITEFVKVSFPATQRDYSALLLCRAVDLLTLNSAQHLEVELKSFFFILIYGTVLRMLFS